MNWLTIKRLGIIAIISLQLGSCNIYSFSGASFDAGMQTFSVQQFRNSASLIVPSLAQQFSERMRNKLLSQTSLKNVARDADADFSGTITQYSITPQAISSGSQTALNRLTITITVRYVNKISPGNNYEQSFSNYEDFSGNIAPIEQELIGRIVDRMIDIVFNRTFADW